MLPDTSATGSKETNSRSGSALQIQGRLKRTDITDATSVASSPAAQFLVLKLDNHQPGRQRQAQLLNDLHVTFVILGSPNSFSRCRYRVRRNGTMRLLH